ncbi:hypothetical protein XELAEV_18031482mg [Xenopus laevis]|uniref:Reverse transcriptase domain-containing protein n=1 Tax=Xenopus laevis TaxID=8355 RepID=A0A974CQ15_XENLA|nr:hypothetical protein XELAEV_18031482mg [Xenopus laevis]
MPQTLLLNFKDRISTVFSNAYLYMGWWEETHVLGGEHTLLQHFITFRSYIDDLLFVWAGSDRLFEEFIASLNNEALNLKFTCCFDRKNIAYLDLWISVENENIMTSVYTKPFAGNSILRADSCHPRNGGIPKGQFLRLRRNCNTVEKFIEESCILRDKFLCKGYSFKSLQKAFISALNSDRKALIKDKKRIDKNVQRQSNSPREDHTERVGMNRKDTNKIIMSMRYSAQFDKIKSLLNKHLPILYGDSVFKQLLEPGIQVVARRAPTLGMILAPSMFNKEAKSSTWLENPGMFRCGSKRCVTCGVVQVSDNFTCNVTKEIYRIKSYINCNTKSVIYIFDNLS